MIAIPAWQLPILWLGTSLNRQVLSNVAIGLALCFAFLHHDINSVFLPISFLFLGIGFLLGKFSIGPKWVFACLSLILVSMAASVPGNILWGDGDWIEGAGLFLMTAPLLGLYLLRDNKSAIAWAMPAILIHSVMVIVEGLTGGYRALGLAINPNPAGGLIVLATVWLVKTPYRWLALLTAFALPFTGSRWGMATMATILVAMATIRFLPLRWAMAMIVVEVATAIGIYLWLASDYVGYATQTSNHMLWRLRIPFLPDGLPHGTIRTDGIHNVPLRMLYEFGIVAPLAWLAATIYGLLKKPWFDTTWWLLAAHTMLGMMDYYTFWGSLTPWFWLLIGLRVKTSYSNVPRVCPSGDSRTGSKLPPCKQDTAIRHRAACNHGKERSLKHWEPY